MTALAVAAVGVGCGGAAEPGFVETLDRVCSEEADSFATINETPPTRGGDVTDQLDAAVAIRADALAELEQIEPPEERSDSFSDYLANREESLAVMRAAATAAAADDRETLDVALARLADLTSDRELIAAQLGADECRTPAGD